jgi:2'-5' RNA ligase
MHLTLKFFKEISEKDVEVVSKILQEVMKEYTPFNLRLSGLGVFPNPQRPRVIWLGLEEHARLIKLREDLIDEMAIAGYSAGRRPFSAHLTLGRLRRHVPSSDFAGISRAVEDVKVDLKHEIEVEEAVLFRSELRASGAEYSKLFSAKLGSK